MKLRNKIFSILLILLLNSSNITQFWSGLIDWAYSTKNVKEFDTFLDSNEFSKVLKLESNINNLDTISYIILSKKYKNKDISIFILSNKVLDDFYIKSTKRIEIRYNNLVKSIIKLPIPDEVKNFSISKIVETSNGFKILVTWGGGNNIYSNIYYFAYMEDNFYFTRYEICQYGPDFEGINKKIKIKNKIPIEKFDFLNYLD